MPTRTKQYYKQKYPTIKVIRENTDNNIPGLQLGTTVTHSREYDYCRNRNRAGYYKVSRLSCKRELRNFKAIDIYTVKWYPKLIITLSSDDESDNECEQQPIN